MMMCVKLSFVFLYGRIFGISARFRLALKVTIGILAIWFIGGVITSVLASPSVKTILERQSLLAVGLGNLLTDLLVFFLPVGMVWRLHTGRRTKIKVTVLFLLGLM